MKPAQAPLKHLALLNPETLGEDTDPDRPFRYIDIAATGRGVLIEEPEALTFATAPSRARRVLRPGDTILSTVRTYLRAAWTLRDKDYDLVASTGFVCLRPRPGVDPRYLGWLTQSNAVVDEVVARSVGVSYPAINPAEIGAIKVPCPSVAKQRAIADYLDRETARIDALIAAKQRLARLLDERWHALRISLVTGTNDAMRPTQSGPDWLGQIPQEWSIERLKVLARMDSGHTPDRKIDTYWLDCTIPWVTLNDVGTLQRDWEINESTNSINELGMANSAAHLLPAGTVILSRDATVGRAAVLGLPMTVSQHFVGWICGPRLRPEYLLHVLRGPMQGHFASLIAGATIATIGMPELSELVVPMPSLDEQDRIVAELRQAEFSFQRMWAALDRQLQLLLEHRHAIISASVTGALAVADAV